MLAFLYTIFIKENNAFSQEHRQLPVVSSSMFGLVLSYINEFFDRDFDIHSQNRQWMWKSEVQRKTRNASRRKIWKISEKSRFLIYVFRIFFMFAWKLARKLRGATHEVGVRFFFIIKTKGYRSFEIEKSAYTVLVPLAKSKIIMHKRREQPQMPQSAHALQVRKEWSREMKRAPQKTPRYTWSLLLLRKHYVKTMASHQENSCMCICMKARFIHVLRILLR